jgi:hypothetical protein
LFNVVDAIELRVVDGEFRTVISENCHVRKTTEEMMYTKIVHCITLLPRG